jgi:uncharacterized membrane protein YfcA
MDLLAAGLLVLAGLGAGFLSGVFGIGSGVILVPVLLLYCHTTGVSSLVATHVAMGTSLLVVMCASLSQAREFSRTDHIVWRGVTLFSLAGVAGAFIGVTVAAGLEGTALRKIFGFVLLVAAVRLFSGKRKPGKELEPNLAPQTLLAAGFLVGFVSALSGAGGSFIALPLMYTYLHFPLRKAIGTSSAAIVVIAAAGAAGYLLRGWGNEFLPPGMPGFIYWQAALPLVAGAIPGVIFGTRAAARADIPPVRTTFAVLLLAVMLRMFFL